MRVQRQNPYFGARPHFSIRKNKEESRMRSVVILILGKWLYKQNSAYGTAIKYPHFNVGIFDINSTRIIIFAILVKQTKWLRNGFHS